MAYNFKKHYYDPYDSLDVRWKKKISNDMISIKDAAALSGFSPQFITIKEVLKTDKTRSFRWREFVNWYSRQGFTPDSPIGISSYSLQKLMEISGMGRSWLLKLVSRYNIASYYVGLCRRFDKEAFEEAWKIESILLKKWLTYEEVVNTFKMSPVDLFTLVGLGKVSVKHSNNIKLYFSLDIKKLKEKGGIHV